MNITKYAIDNPIVTYTLTLLAVIGGVFSYINLGKLEDPEFTIKEAVVVTQYPGSSALEVEEEVTDKLEIAIQQLKQLDKIWSESRPGLSIIHVEVKDKFDKESLPQVWDELRRKIYDIRSDLPAGCKEPVVNDDFGDVYGVYFALTGENYTMRELYNYAKLLRKELLLCQNVAKVKINGYTTETLYIETSRTKMAQLGINPNAIFQAINDQNLVGNGGKVEYKDEYITINTTGAFDTINSINNLLIRGTNAEKLVRLGDIVNIKRDYYDPASSIMEFNGKPALGIGISTTPGTNVVIMGKSVENKLKELEDQTPLGMKLKPIYFQSQIVTESINGFVINLIEALIIVILLLFVFMGRHEGIIIGAALLITILITFIGMEYFEVTMQRVSLGALIIALGMLVDNAIVVAEGIVVKMQRGVEKRLAAEQTVSETKWPLLGATIIAIIAFSSISLSKDSTGEFLTSLFTVIALSLFISWVIAITFTPLLCIQFITKNDASNKDPHDNFFFRQYARLLRCCIHHRYIIIIAMVLLLVVSVRCFSYVDKSFFPSSTRNMFLIDLWMKEGSHIHTTNAKAHEIEEKIRKLKHVTDIAQMTGEGALRFTLTYNPETTTSSYAQLLVYTDTYENIDKISPQISKMLEHDYPDIQNNIKKLELGPSTSAKIEVRFIGPDTTILHQLADQAKKVFSDYNIKEGIAHFIRDDWRQPVKSFEIDIADVRARNAGISRPDINKSISNNYSGTPIGVFREEDELLPIIARPPLEERDNISDLADILIWSSIHGKPVPLTQVVDNISIVWKDNIIRRRNRQRCITAQCEPTGISGIDFYNRVKKDINAIKLPVGYSKEWGGELESSQRSQRKLLMKFPLVLLIMFVILLLLFRTLRHPIIVFLGLPLSVIGVTWGLLIFDSPFSFTALLGFLSLTGMLIKNEIVLLDQINIERNLGKEPFTAIIEASISRVRPVCMAAFTTVLGMLPLVFDPFFKSLAVTIMGGLTFATVLTLIFVPVIYATFFRIRDKNK